MEVKIGLEIHCQLTGLQSKLFCSCQCDYRGKAPNTNICPICSGLPGTLPLLNQRAVDFASMISLALGCKVPDKVMFYRKNYFYPDLPKNFQITQYNAYGITSIGVEGRVDYGIKSTKIRRVQLEEDPGRLIYDTSFYTLIDYNRAGVSLVEIVTEPDFAEPKDVRMFLNKITSIIEHLGVGDTKLDGSVRCDVNVSLEGGKRVEIKNVGSFRDVEKALGYEITRQKTMSVRDIEIKSETRHWDEARKVTKQSRAKEEEEDYRYFPEPDIPTIVLGNEFLSSLKAKMPELPDERKIRFLREYELSDHVAQVLIDNKELADFFESTVKIYSSSPNEIANWIVSDLLGFIDDSKREEGSLFSGLRIEAKHMAELVKMIDQNIINRNIAKMILGQITKTGEMPSYVLDKMNASLIDSKAIISEAIESIFNSEKSAVRDAKQNPNAANFLLGKVMQLTGGRADPKIALNLIKTKLAVLE
ncbi:MAG: Asp-tRNA(Asn)/Glu-tRNA(Gln) amidotransferase subunit GatB [Nitrosopumilales archaeon]|nr:Asp-tRNA(Asn)/Glu-tRNA(Gln) amidotransferase subunit GatB [Nitrosopumilales archaeon]MRN68211.1 Asp-tRNA(Asn)/Glu-tRNA(Gln) amidotransferase subunit GatB [Nitrosopumilales archaeon]